MVFLLELKLDLKVKLWSFDVRSIVFLLGISLEVKVEHQSFEVRSPLFPWTLIMKPFRAIFQAIILCLQALAHSCAFKVYTCAFAILALSNGGPRTSSDHPDHREAHEGSSCAIPGCLGHLYRDQAICEAQRHCPAGPALLTCATLKFWS